MHYISNNDGYHVVSVTTDGFITNMPELEERIIQEQEKLMKSNPEARVFSLLNEYRKIRKILSGNSNGLELKTHVKGIINLKTRGQINTYNSSNNINSPDIVALTGIQRRNVRSSLGELQELLSTTYHSSYGNSIECLYSSLRSATDIFKDGGHVTPIYRDQTYSLDFDHKRRISGTLKNTSLIDSMPLKNYTEGRILRLLAKKHKNSYMNKVYVGINSSKKYLNKTDLAVRNFIKGLFNGDFNLVTDFTKYSDISSFLKGFKNTKVSHNYLSKLKFRKDTRIKVPRMKETEEFVEFIKNSFKFDSFEAFEKSFFL
jgi:hypothetical protein